MAQVLGVSLPSPAIVSNRRLPKLLASASLSSNCSKSIQSLRSKDSKLSWDSLQQSLRCNAKVSCLFADNRKQDQARKALESALGGNKSEFAKWDKELKRKEEAGRGGNSGGGGWFGWFGGSNGDHFWHEAQQISFTLLGIIALYLIFAKGDVLVAVVINPLLFLLRGTRNSFKFVSSLINKRVSPGTNWNAASNSQEGVTTARGNVVRKWGSE